MDKKFFVPFKTAQQLREKGYPNNSEMLYDNETGELISSAAYANPKYWIDDKYMYLIAAPTYHEVLDWLEEKGIYITCYAPLSKPVGRYAISVFNSNTNNINDWGLCRDAYPTREEAINDGILKALEML